MYPVETLPENSLTVLERRYLVKDQEGNPQEAPIDLMRRVAAAIADAEETAEKKAEYYEKFYSMLCNLEFMPNSPTLMNAGRVLGQLSACFVLPVEDSIDDIFDAIKWTAKVHKTGGGTGFSFSRLRPKDDWVQSTQGVASGPVSFMKIFDAATEQVKQGGTRRGANMGILRVDHPDILDFITCKADMVSITNFNISVAITEKFMDALFSGGEYALIHPVSQQPVGYLNARQVWDQIIQGAWQNGDPGLIFIDRINQSKANPVPYRGPIESTNPCGEQPLYPFDSCNLGSINLSKFAVTEGDKREIAFDRLWSTVVLAVRFLDNVITVNKYPLPQIAETSNAIRRIGLGVMGWADLLMDLRIPYNSQEAIDLADRVMGIICMAANSASADLGEEKGSFPDFDKSIYTKDFSALRNSTRTTIAPTGTISLIAGNCSGGIEPLFSLAFYRQHYLEKKDYLKTSWMAEVNERFLKVAKEEGFYSEELIDRLASGGSLKDEPDVPQWVKDVFVTSHDIAPEWHVRMQAAFQAKTDNAVSKTINFPNSATLKDVEEAYMLAYETGCMGITIYRDGSRDKQVLTHKKEEPITLSLTDNSFYATNTTSLTLNGNFTLNGNGHHTHDGLGETHFHGRKRLPDERQSITHKFQVGEQEGYIHVGLYDDGQPGEVFITMAKEGSTVSGLIDSLATTLSLALQYGVPINVLAARLQGGRYEPAGFTKNSDIPIASSVTDYIFRWLERKFAPQQVAEKIHNVEKVLAGAPSGMLCHDCGSLMYASEGCLSCVSCGYSKC